jgi:RIO-like serine/threonine protein kinase
MSIHVVLIGHRNSYERKVLHRDISVGNIIITGKLEPGGRGVLIDYDNAILLGENYTPLLDDAPSVCKFRFCFEYC